MLKAKYVPPIDKERTNAKDYSILSHWFELFARVKAEHNIQEEDIYNMDGKGFLQGAVAKMKVMICKDEMQQYVTQCGNRDWVSLIECVSADGRVLKPWLIFKAKVHQRSWYDELDEGHICVTENGWTNNEIGLQWLKDCFDAETKDIKKGRYRLLCLDGHASHISAAVIDYCIQHDIVLLCLPAHTTDLLQPLDIGIFAPLAVHYKNIVHQNSKLHGHYWVNKERFIEFYQQARYLTYTPAIVKSAWQKAGLCPFKPSIILDRFKPKKSQEPPESLLAPGQKNGLEPKNALEPNGLRKLPTESPTLHYRPTTPPEMVISYSNTNGKSIDSIVARTPANCTEVMQLMRDIYDGKLDKEAAIKKLAKASTFAMADATIQSRTNQELVDVSKRNEKKKNRTKGTFGHAQVLNIEVKKLRQQEQEEKSLAKREKQFGTAWKTEFGALLSNSTHTFALWVPLKKPRKSQTPRKPCTPRKGVTFAIPATPGTPVSPMTAAMTPATAAKAPKTSAKAPKTTAKAPTKAV